MKKQHKRLVLNKQIVRNLSAMAAVHGGIVTGGIDTAVCTGGGGGTQTNEDCTTIPQPTDNCTKLCTFGGGGFCV
jgi:hypothetical protein